MTAPIRVVVAEGRTTAREGLVALLGLLPDIEVVAAASDGPAALAAVGRHHPDVVLMDVRLPGLDGGTVTRQLAAHHPGTAVVVLTGHADDEAVLAALAAGARGFLTTNAGRREISAAILSAAAGPVGAAQVGQVPAELPDGLTRREAEVLTLIAAGLSNREISEHAHISPATVKTHINRIFAKAAVTDRSAAVRYAHRHHLVE